MTDIKLMGNTIHTMGQLPAVGSQALDFTVTKMDLSEIRLKHYLGQKIVLNIFPSLDTQTCASAMLKFEEIAKSLDNVLVLCISSDLPFAQKRFCSVENLQKVQPVSVFRHPAFGQDYGVTIQDGPLSGLLSRAVIVLDEKGKVVYTEQVAEITEEPNYQAITKVLKKASQVVL